MAEGEFSLEAVRLFMIENEGRVTNHQLVTRFKNFLSDPQRKGEYREKFKDFVNLLASIKEEEGEKYLVLKKRYRELGCANLFANRDNSAGTEDGGSPVVDHGASPGSVAAAAAAHDAVAKQSAATGGGSSGAPSAASRAGDAEPTAVAAPLSQPTERIVIKASSGATSTGATPLVSLGDSKAATASQDFGFYSSGAAGSSRPQVTISARTPVAVPAEGAAAVPSGRTEQQQPVRGKDGNGSLAAAATTSVSTTSPSASRTGVLQAMVLGSKGGRAPWDSGASSSGSDKDRPLAADPVPASAAAPAVPVIVEPTDVSAGAPPAAPASSTTSSSSQQLSPRQAAAVRSQGWHSRSSRAGSEPPTSTGSDRASTAGGGRSTSGSPPSVEERSSVAVEEPKISVKERTRAINRMTSDTDISYGGSGAQFKARKRESRLNATAHDFEDGESAAGMVQVALDADEREWMLVSSSADLHAMTRLLRKNPVLARQKDFTCGYTGLHWAAKHGNLDVVKLLITNKADVNVRSHGGFTPLHLAVMHSQYEAVELLVRVYDASISIRDYSGKRPKQYLKRDSPPAVQGLLQDASRPVFSLSGAGSVDSGLGRTASFKSKRSSATSFSSRVSKVLSSSSENVKGGDDMSPAGTPTQSPRVSRKTPSFIFGFGKDSSSQQDSNREQMPPPSLVPSSHARNKRVSKMVATSSAAMQPSATVGRIKDYTDSSADGSGSSTMVRSGSAPEIAKPIDHAESQS